MSRPINSRMHGMLDYPAGALLIVSPWLFGFSDQGGAAVAVPVVIGILVILQSLVTDYEFSVAKLLPLSGHLAMDTLAGAVLALSPFIFGFSDEVWVPHVLFGLLLIASGLTTQTERDTDRGATRAR